MLAFGTKAVQKLNQYIIIETRTKEIGSRMNDKTEALYTKVIKIIGFSHHQRVFSFVTTLKSFNTKTS